MNGSDSIALVFPSTTRLVSSAAGRSRLRAGAVAILLGLLARGMSTRLPAQDCTCLDVVLTIDTSGDMRHVVHAMAQNAASITAAVAQASNDARVGLVTFRDPVWVEHDLSPDLASVEAAVAGLRALTGAGDPENWDGAADYAANREPLPPDGPTCGIGGTLDAFRPGCHDLVVVFTNAPPSGCDDQYVEGFDDLHAKGVATLAATNGITISTVLSDNGHLITGGYPDGVEPALLEFVANETGGTFAVVPDVGDGGVIAIQDAILAACAGICADGVCGPGEDPCSCPEDCGLPDVTETNCSDGVDDDCDGLVDCDDGDCDGDPVCDSACGGNKAPCAVDEDCCSLNCGNGRCKGGGSGGSLPVFVRGDANDDSLVDVADGVFTLSYLFGGGRKPVCLDAADADDDGVIAVVDPIVTFAYLFSGGAKIAAPHPTLGEDPTADALDCTR